MISDNRKIRMNKRMIFIKTHEQRKQKSRSFVERYRISAMETHLNISVYGHGITLTLIVVVCTTRSFQNAAQGFFARQGENEYENLLETASFSRMLRFKYKIIAHFRHSKS